MQQERDTCASVGNAALHFDDEIYHLSLQNV
jgi:hypothetical protein